MKLTKEREKELLNKEEELDALRANGVDNWEWYDDALSNLRKKREKETHRRELCNEILDNILEILCEGIDEPAGSGAGFGFRFDVQETALEFLIASEITFTE